MAINKHLKYALVLSGGGARGLAHIGILCAMEKAGYPPPSLISGTSMGAIVGGLYAMGMKGPDLKRYVLDELDIPGFMESSVFKMEGPIGRIFQTGKIIGQAATKPGIDSGDKVLRLLDKLTNNKEIVDCGIPFLCNAVDISAGREVIFRSGSLAKAIRASMSFPFIFEPFIEGGQCLVDGGVADNMPIKLTREAARKLKIRQLLAVDVCRWHNIPPDSLKNGLSVILRCFDAMVHVSETDGDSQIGEANLVIHASDKTSAFDFSRKRELMELGEMTVTQSKNEIDAFFGTGIKGAIARRKKVSCGVMMESFYNATKTKEGEMTTENL
jgi:NTE family protein